MVFVSTRDKNLRASAAEAIVRGIAPDGGLYVPEETPRVDAAFIAGLCDMPYYRRAASVLRPWLNAFEAEEIERMCRGAYARFDDAAVAPVRPLSGGRYVLELWHGPTLAFKDMALQLLPALLAASARKCGQTRKIVILTATSGDTGKAALEGFAGVEGVEICVFYPYGGVSEAQRLQMVTQEGANTHVFAVEGNFDDAQTGVKRIFTDADFAARLNGRGMMLSSANSINLGRLLPQIAYYFSAYADLISAGAVKLGEAIDIAVPTGNFGNILAAHYAARMGLPVARLVCASNSNNVLSEFIETGVYDRRRAFHLTSSPSMDILISSNLERMLYELAGADDKTVCAWMNGLKNEGFYKLRGDALKRLKSLMWGGWADEAAVKRQIARAFKQEGYLTDPHTAVALDVAEQYAKAREQARPLVIASTASPYKFGRTVAEAILGADAPQDEFEACRRLAKESGVQLPRAIAGLSEKKVLHTGKCAPNEMMRAVEGALGL